MRQTDHAASSRPAAVRMLRWLVNLGAAAAGMYYSYGFGRTIGGPLVGVVLALNGAVFCSIVASALVDQLGRWRPAVGPRDRHPSPG